jgi:hypothetical protein
MSVVVELMVKPLSDEKSRWPPTVLELLRSADHLLGTCRPLPKLGG